MRVLVAEDFEILARAIARGLRREGMAVDVALDGQDALESLAVTRYDVVVLDRDLPGTHGDEVCRRLADRDAAPMVLMLTALSGTGDRVDGLTLGADDYLGKPFSFAELVLRVKALGRRGRAHSAVLTRGDLTVDTLRHTAHRAGRPVALTAKEFAVLQILLAADGAVLSQEQLLERAWDEHADPFTNTVRVTVNRLRRKLGPPDLVETVIGAGYRIAP
jgi:DNA-binding response OmpR family regulator